MNLRENSGTHQEPHVDLEKQFDLKDSSVNITASNESHDVHATRHDIAPAPILLTGRLARWNARVESLAGLEARGITRVQAEEKHGVGLTGYFQMFTLWFSMNIVPNNLIVGFLGPLVFDLGWIDCILGRYFMGYWPSKIACLLNVILQLGWGIISSIIAGQMFSAVNGRGLSITVGCVIGALCIGLVATFGIGLIHNYERYAWIPPIMALLVLIGSAGGKFNTSLPSAGPTGTITANRCSFFALEFSTAIGFSTIGADFYVYYPTNTSRRLTFLMTWAGLWTSLILVNLIGVGIATGVATNPAWNDAYGTSSGALLLACYDGLGGFGGLCVVILALGCIANNAPATYSAALSLQVLGRYTAAIPRWILCLTLMTIEIACAVGGRNHLFNIFENFLPIMSYWICPWLTIALQEHLIFHELRGVSFDWTAWEDKKRLPIGIAALIAWLCGWAGAIVGMDQAWYQGPVGLMIGGGYGADIGAWMAIAFTFIVFPPLRYWELKKFGR